MATVPVGDKLATSVNCSQGTGADSDGDINGGSMVVQFVSDNEAVVAVFNSGYARDGVLMHLVWCLFFIAASFSFWYSACHIPGRLNVVSG